MSFWTLCVITHLLITLYVFFTIWRDGKLENVDVAEMLEEEEMGGVFWFLMLCPFFNAHFLWCGVKDDVKYILLAIIYYFLHDAKRQPPSRRRETV